MKKEVVLLFKNIFLMFIHFWERERERERESVSGGGAEREGDTESEAGSRLPAISAEPDVGLEPTNHEIMTLGEVECFPDWATQTPQGGGLIKNDDEGRALCWADR